MNENLCKTIVNLCEYLVEADKELKTQVKGNLNTGNKKFMLNNTQTKSQHYKNSNSSYRANYIDKTKLDAELANCSDTLTEIIAQINSDPYIVNVLQNAYTKDFEDAFIKAEKYYKQPVGTYREYVRAVNNTLAVLGNSRYNYYVPSEENLRILYSLARRLLVDAAAGVGKTITIIIKQYIEQAVFRLKPEDILSITYTKAGAISMFRKYESLNKDFYSNSDSDGLSLGFKTIHSYCSDLLSVIDNTNKKVINLDEVLKIEVDNPNFDEEEDDIDQMFITKKILLTDLIRSACNSVGITKCMVSMESIYSAISVILEFRIASDEEFRDIEQYTDYPLSYQELILINNKYVKEKEKWDVIDYNDMLVNVYKYLKSVLEDINTNGRANALASIKKSILKRILFKSIYVDEFQDVSPLQMDIINTLVEINPESRLTCIGDGDQSIYSFKGADIKYILQFPLTYKSDDLDVIYLTRNRRSVKLIIDLSNLLIKNNLSRFPKMIRGLDGDERKGSVSLKRDYNGKISYGIIINRIEEIKSTNMSYLTNMAIIYREHSQAQQFFSYLIQDKLPFFCSLTTKSANYVVNNPILKQFRDIYYLAKAPNNYDFVKDGLYYIVPNMTRDDAYDIYLKMRQDSSLRLSKILRQNSFWSQGIYNLKILVDMCKNPKISTIEFFMVASSIYRDCYFNNYISKNRSKKQKVNKESLDLVMDYLKSYPNLDNFLNYYNKDLVWLKANTNNKASISLTTMHGSKGMEWNETYILGISDNITPKVSQLSKLSLKGKKAYIEEERRLIYTAVTRAKTNVTIFYETLNEEHPGYFIEEILDALNKLKAEYGDQITID